jgi:hypothetical protein
MDIRFQRSALINGKNISGECFAAKLENNDEYYEHII